jgi:O-antigen/teichoic acid export membrane protein
MTDAGAQSLELPRLRLAILRNSAWLLGSRVISQGLAAAFTVIVARGLGETGLGQYAFIASLFFIANVATTFGTDTYLIREVAARPERAPVAVRAVLAAQLILSGACILAAGAAARLALLSPEMRTPIFVFSLALIPMVFYSVYSAVLRARERMDYYLWINLAYSGVQAAGAPVVIGLGGGLVGIAYLALGASIVSAILAAGLGRRSLVGFKNSAGFAVSSLQILRQTLPLATLTILAVSYQRLGILMLAFLIGDAAAGWFSAPARLVELLKFAHISLLGGLLPILARLPAREVGPRLSGTPRFQALSRWSLWILVLFGLSAALALTLAAPVLIGLVFGGRFGPSIPALQILAWILVPYSVSSHQSLVLVARGQERSAALATFLALFLFAGLGLILVPWMGVSGGAAAAVASETGLATLLWYFRKRREEPR